MGPGPNATRRGRNAPHDDRIVLPARHAAMSLRRTRVFVRASALFVSATEFGAGEDRVVRRHPRVSLRGTTVIANSRVLRSVRRVERARTHGLRGEASV